MKSRIVATLFASAVALGCPHAFAGSTIDPAQPANGSPLNSAPLRANFQAAYNDINNILSMYYGPTAPSAPSNFQSWANSSSYPVVTLNYYNAATATWVQYGVLNVATNTYASNVGATATAPLSVTFNNFIPTFALNYSASFSLSSGALALNLPTPSVPGGVFSSTAPANQFATGVNTSGNFTYAQPSFGNIAGINTASQGGSGIASPSAHSLMIAEGASPYNLLAANIGGRVLLDQGSGIDPAFEAMSGDATLAANGALTLATSGVTAGTYGDGTHSTQVTFDAKGRATSASSVVITHASGDLALSSLGTNVESALGNPLNASGGLVGYSGALGTPTSGAATNLTGTAAGLTAGNANELLSGTWAIPGAIGATTPNSGVFTTLSAQSGTVTGPWYINQGSFTPSVSFPSAAAPFGVNEAATGTCTTGNNNCYFNFLNINSDNAVIGSGSSGIWVTGTGFLVNHDFGGSATTGNRSAGLFILKQTATTGNTALGADYSALVANTTATANDNGTGVTNTTARGQVESLNAIAHLGPSATDFFALQGAEIDTNAETGSSVYYKTGQQITQLSTDAAQGAVFDAAETIANQTGAVGWKGYGLVFGSPTGIWPFTSAATVIGCWSSCGSATSFIDMTNATFSGYFLKDSTFSVAGNGATIINTSGVVGNALKVESSDGSNGGTINLVNTTAAAPSPNKFIRVDSSGDLQILNSAASASIMTLPDSGAPTFKGLTTAGLVTTTSGGLLGSETAITPTQCPAATSSAIGCAKPDGTTITVSGGVLTAVGAATTSIDAGGATSITNGTAGGILIDNGGKVGMGISASDIASLSTAQTIPGDKTFTGTNTAPTQAARDNSTKLATTAYADADSTFGAWVTDAISTVYQASTDGFVVVDALSSTNSSLVSCITDSNPSPSTIRNEGQASLSNYHIGCMTPVRKGDYWKVTTNGVSSSSVYWLPRGN